jgi:hypothetical protein
MKGRKTDSNMIPLKHLPRQLEEKGFHVGENAQPEETGVFSVQWLVRMSPLPGCNAIYTANTEIPSKDIKEQVIVRRL